MSKAQFLDVPGLTRHTENMFEYIDSKIPTSLPANGGNADTVNQHTVKSDVPENAKFTDTVYTHPVSGVTAGTYKSLTVDENGHVTAGTNPTTLSGYGITDAATKTQGDKADTAVQTVKIGDISYSGTTVSLPEYPTTLPASDVSSWAKASTKPTYTYSEVGADKSGAADAALSEAKDYIDEKVANLLENSTEAVDSIYELRDAMEENADAIEALTTIAGNKASSSDLTSHVNDTIVHITSSERTDWNAAKAHADTDHAPSDAEVNQNAFSNVAIGSTTIPSTGKTDTLTMVAGSNVTLTPDTTNRKITITAIDTVYTHPSYDAKPLGLYKVTVDSTGHISAANTVTKDDIIGLGIPSENTTYGDATTSAAGLMTAAMVTKLNGIDAGANKYTLPTATDEILGGVKIGSNITISDGVISLDKEDVIAALGYTPSESSTSYTHPSYTARTGVPTADQAPAFGGTFTVSQPVSDATGHITAINSRTIAIPSSTATTTAAGLMSSTDKTKLESCLTAEFVSALPSSPDSNTFYVVS